MSGRLFLALFIFFLGSGVISAAEGDVPLQPSTIKVDQVYLDLPDAKIFFWASDSTGQLVDRIDLNKLQLMLGQKILSLKDGAAVKKFSDMNEGVAYTLLLDVSLSVKGKGIEYEKEAAAAFISKLTPADQLALIAFGNRVEVLTSFTKDQGLLLQKVNSLTAESRNTLLLKALDVSFKQNNTSAADIPQRRAIIVLSDGQDEGSGITIEELKEGMAFPVYTIGYNGKREEFIPELTRIADISGGLYIHLTDIGEAVGAYERIKEFIRSQFVLKLKICDLDPDLTYRVLEITLNEELLMNARKNVRLVSSRSSEERRKECGVVPRPEPKSWPLWLILSGAGVIVLLLSGSIWLLRRRAKRKAEALERAAGGDGAEPSLVSAEGLAQMQKSPLQTDEGEQPSPGTAGEASLTVAGPGTGPGAEPADEAGETKVAFAVLGGGNKGERITLPLRSNRLIIGRGGLSDLVLDDELISSEHAILSKENNLYAIMDNESTNGVFVNGVRIHSIKRIERGDVVALGGCKLRFLGEE